MRNANIARIRRREREWDSWWRYEASREALMRAGDGKEKTVVGSFPRDSQGPWP